jgi:hypothetical protein
MVPDSVVGLAVALGIGLLIGLDRERRKGLNDAPSCELALERRLRRPRHPARTYHGRPTLAPDPSRWRGSA